MNLQIPRLSWIAEITQAKEIDIKIDKIPAWFDEYVLKKFSQEESAK